jgi:hypothetical protein
VSAIFLAALLSLALAWEASQIHFSLRLGAANFGRAHSERATNPRGSWPLLGIHVVLVLISSALVVLVGATYLS